MLCQDRLIEQDDKSKSAQLLNPDTSEAQRIPETATYDN